jgi:ribosomal protein L11 methyltransferase
MDLWEIRIEIPAEAAGPTDDALLEFGRAEWSILEDAIARKAWIVGVFPGAAEAEAGWSELVPILPSKPGATPTPRHLPDADWKHSYREHFKAWNFGRLHWVPVWERDGFRLPEAHAVLWLDPGMAFGTGNHETTRLCIERLVSFEAGLSVERKRLPVIDAGCGSGILALSASLLGFPSVYGFDVDPEAVRVSHENAQLNGLASAVRFATAGLPEGLENGQAGVVLANIQSDVLMRNAGVLVNAVAPGGLLSLSGILATELPMVRETFANAARGWTVDSRVLGEWSDVALVRPPA